MTKLLPGSAGIVERYAILSSVSNTLGKEMRLCRLWASYVNFLSTKSGTSFLSNLKTHCTMNICEKGIAGYLPHGRTISYQQQEYFAIERTHFWFIPTVKIGSKGNYDWFLFKNTIIVSHRVSYKNSQSQMDAFYPNSLCFKDFSKPSTKKDL